MLLVWHVDDDTRDTTVTLTHTHRNEGLINDANGSLDVSLGVHFVNLFADYDGLAEEMLVSSACL